MTEKMNNSTKKFLWKIIGILLIIILGVGSNIYTYNAGKINNNEERIIKIEQYVAVDSTRALYLTKDMIRLTKAIDDLTIKISKLEKKIK